MSSNYYSDRNKSTIEKLRSVMEELPLFCRDFFVGIENSTSALTRLNYAYDLRTFFLYLIQTEPKFANYRSNEFTIQDVQNITATDIEFFLSYLSFYTYNGKEYHNNERAKVRKLAAIRCLYKYLFNKDLVFANTAAKVTQPKVHEKEIVRLDKDEMHDLLEVVESGNGLSDRQKAFHEKTKTRDIAIVTLFLGTGIRISELVGLNNDDVDLISNTFRVTRKGGNQTVLFFSDEVGEALAAYMAEKEDIVEKESKRSTPVKRDPDALFLSGQNKRINVRSVENIVKKYSSLITLKNISPHKLRSTYGTELYRATRDIYIVADVLGHKDINITKKHYAAMSEDIRKNAADRVKLHEEVIEEEEGESDGSEDGEE